MTGNSTIMRDISACRQNSDDDAASHSDAARQNARVIAITSGKGGVGKTNITTNLAISLAQRGEKVCVFDADTSLANINILMGLTPQYTIEHLLSGEKTIDEILLEGPAGVTIVPAASGIAEFANLTQQQQRQMIDALTTLEQRFDYLLIDTAAGIGKDVINFIASAQYVILILSTEPTSLTDAFALLRVLKRQGIERPLHVLINTVLNYANSMEVFRRFEGAVNKYLDIEVSYLGYIVDDEALKKSVAKQQPVILWQADAVASRCLSKLGQVTQKQFASTGNGHHFSEFWKNLALHGPENNHESQLPAAGGESAASISDRIDQLASDFKRLVSDQDTTSAEALRLFTTASDAMLERLTSDMEKTETIDRETLAARLSSVEQILALIQDERDHSRYNTILDNLRELNQRIETQGESLDQGLSRLNQLIRDSMTSALR